MFDLLTLWHFMCFIVNPDVDSIASAIAAAYICNFIVQIQYRMIISMSHFNLVWLCWNVWHFLLDDGIAARASDINSEAKYVLKQFGFPEPQLIDNVIKQHEGKNNPLKICLLDHNQHSQMSNAIPIDSIKGIIDHHAIQSEIVQKDEPIHVEIRPVGSVSLNFILSCESHVYEHMQNVFCFVFVDLYYPCS